MMIDDHCHPFALTPVPFDPATCSLDVEVGGAADERRRVLGPQRLSQALLTAMLAERFGCDPGDVPAAREQAAADWRAYVSGLFADAGITDLVMDPAWPAGAADHLDDYRAVSGCRIHPILRIEPIIDRAIAQGAGTSEILALVTESMARAEASGYVGFKTIIAYRTGLAIDPDATIEQADRSLRSDEPVRRRGKPLRDLVLRRAIGIATDLGLPFQIHSGIGDSEIRLAEANPLLLEELLRTSEGAAARIVLIHGSFPWHEELAYLAAAKPNVWADLSLFMLFSPTTMADRLLRAMDLAPVTRVMLGTDAFAYPELFWFGARLCRDAWTEVERRLASAGLPSAWLRDAGAAIFEDNARALYGIAAPAAAGSAVRG